PRQNRDQGRIPCPPRPSHAWTTNPRRQRAPRPSHLTQRHHERHSSLHLQNYKSQRAPRATQPHEALRAYSGSFPWRPTAFGAKVSAAYRPEPQEPREPLRKQFLSEENMATHFSQLSLHNDHPYCSPPMTFSPALPPLRSPCSELLLWRYPGSLIPEALRLLRLGDTPSPPYPATPAGDIMEL
uniref:Host cell factor C1 regulator 1 n=2 Tax=Hominidae TaxID=9604 RepID=A0A2J8S7Y6_PONAB